MVKKRTKKKIVAPPSNLYRNIALSFIIAVVIIVGLVLYFSLSGVTIVVKPKKEVLTTELSIDMNGNPAEGEVYGIVREKVLERSNRVALSGEGTTIETQATGRVTIINNTARNQTLVRTTRLLTPDNKLFRLSETVVAPARGSVEADVYADEPGIAGEIGPTRFMIPGLWEGLRDKIYAESTEPICCGTKMVRIIEDEDLTRAESELSMAMVEEAKAYLGSRVTPEDEAGRLLSDGIYLSEILEREVDAAVGEERSEFNIVLKIKVVGINYDEDAVREMARIAINDMAGSDREIVEFDPSRINVVAERYDVRGGTARLVVEAKGLAILKSSRDIFDKDRLIGLDRAGLEDYFRTFSSIESVDIEFRPPWLDRAPRLKDHIEIKIEE